MNITILGIVWITMLIVAFLNKNPKYIITMTLFSMVFQSASLVILGSNGIGPQIITSIFMIFYSIKKSSVFISAKLRITFKTPQNNVSFFCICCFILIIIISRLSNKGIYKIETIQYILLFFQLLIYILCYFACWSIGKLLSREQVQKIFMGVIFFVAAIAIVQFFTTTNILPRNIILETFLYTPDTDSAYYWTTYYPRVFSTFMEPSYCGAFLTGAFYYVISQNNKNRYYIILSLVLIVELILTFSSTAYGAFALCGIIYIAISKNKKALKHLIPLGFVAVIFLVITGQLEVILGSTIFNKASTGSYITRAGWNNQAYNAFQLSPLLGVGYKNVRASQFILSLLGQLGILGCVTWIFIWFPLLLEILRNNCKELTSAALNLIGGLIAMFIAIPDIDFCVFWQSMYLLALVMGNYRKEIRNNATQTKYHKL